MDELNLLEKLESVKAPPGFEQRVLAQLSVRKRKKQRVRNLSLSAAGAFSAALVIFIVLNVFILPEKKRYYSPEVLDCSLLYPIERRFQKKNFPAFGIFGPSGLFYLRVNANRFPLCQRY